MFSVYANVLLGLPLKHSYTYQLPDPAKQDAFIPGSRVLVLFNNRTEIGIIEKLHSQPPQEEILPINELLDPRTNRYRIPNPACLLAFCSLSVLSGRGSF